MCAGFHNAFTLPTLPAGLLCSKFLDSHQIDRESDGPYAIPLDKANAFTLSLQGLVLSYNMDSGSRQPGAMGSDTPDSAWLGVYHNAYRFAKAVPAPADTLGTHARNDSIPQAIAKA